MKVFLATLLIVGLAAALPNPKTIISNLKIQLQQDVQVIKTHTQGLAEQVVADAKDGMAAVKKNPFEAIRPLISTVHKDAKAIITSSVTDGKTVNQHIQAAINELKQVDTGSLVPILDNLKQQIDGDIKDAKVSVQELLKQVLGHLGDDVKALLTDPNGAAKIIQDNWNTDYDQFVTESQKYVSTIQQQIQDALDKIDQQFDQ